MIRVGFVVGEFPPEERTRRIDVALSYSSTEIEIGIVGERVGVLIYRERLLPVARTVIRRYGMESLIAGYRFSGLDLPDIAANREALVENFLVRARELIREEGADVIYPMGVAQCPVHMKPLWLQEQLGVPVVEGIGAPIRMAVLLVSLGLRQSRVRWPKAIVP